MLQGGRLCPISVFYEGGLRLIRSHANPPAEVLADLSMSLFYSLVKKRKKKELCFDLDVDKDKKKLPVTSRPHHIKLANPNAVFCGLVFFCLFFSR